MLIYTTFIIFMLSSFFICMFIFTCLFYILNVYFTFYIWRKQFFWCCSFLSCLPLAEIPNEHAAGPCCLAEKNLITTYFWWMGVRNSVPCSNISSADESGLPEFTKQWLGRLRTLFPPKFVDTPQAEEGRTRQEMEDELPAPTAGESGLAAFSCGAGRWSENQVP